jgi:DnaJ-class molecular chaperone
MQNPYQTLGVDRNVSADEIKRAYRKLASQHHPDKGGDKTRFQEIQAAYDTLSNAQKRAAYDNPHHQFDGLGSQPFNFDSIFNVFGARFGHPQQQRQQNQRAMMSLWITLPDVARGGPKTISVGTQQGTMTVEIEIPPGIDDGASVQYPGIGPGGMDLVITFRIHPNPRWERQANNLITDQTIDVWSLILGCDINVQDILGNSLSLTVPSGTQPNTLLRLRGRGLKNRSGQTGDLLIRVQAQIPKDIPEDLIAVIRSKYQK